VKRRNECRKNNNSLKIKIRKRKEKKKGVGEPHRTAKAQCRDRGL